MAWAFVRGVGTAAFTTTGTDANAGTGLSATESLTITNTAGDTLVAVAGTYNASGVTMSIADTLGNTWGHKTVLNADANTQLDVFYCLSCAGGSNTLTFTCAAAAKPYWEYGVGEWSGGNTPTLESSGTLSEGAAVTAHSVSTAAGLTAGDLLVSTYLDPTGGSTFSAFTGTNRFNDNTQLDIDTQEVLSSGAGVATVSVTTSAATTGDGILLAFKAGASGTTVVSGANPGVSRHPGRGPSRTRFYQTPRSTAVPAIPLALSGSISAGSTASATVASSTALAGTTGGVSAQTAALITPFSWTFVRGMGTASWTTGAGTDANAGSGLSATESLAMTNTAGDTLVAVAGTYNASGVTMSIADTLGNTWVQKTVLVGSLGPTQLDVFYCLNCAGGSNTVTFTCASGVKPNWEYAVMEWGGGNTPTLESSGTLDEGFTTHTVHSASTTAGLTGGDLLVSTYLAGVTSSTFSAFTGTDRANDNTRVSIDTQEILSSGSGVATVSVTTNTAVAGVAVLLALKAGLPGAWPLAGNSRSASGQTATLGLAAALAGASSDSFAASSALSLSVSLAATSASASTSSASASQAKSLGGAASAASGQVAGLAEAVTLTGTTGSVGAQAGTLGVATAVTLAGTAVASSSQSATVTLSTALSGSASAATTASAGLNSASALSGSAQATSVQTGSLALATSIGAASSAAISSQTASLTFSAQVAGTAAAVSTTSAALAIATTLAGSGYTVSGISGNLTEVVALGAAAQATSSQSGNLQTLSGLQVAGTSSAVGSSTASLSVKTALAGSVYNTSVIAGGVSQVAALGAITTAVSAQNGNLSTATLLSLSGLASGASAQSGNLIISANLGGSSAGASTLASQLALSLVLASTSRSASAQAGALGFLQPLAGSTAATSTAAGQFALGLAFGGQSSAQSRLAATLPLAVALAGPSSSNTVLLALLALAGVGIGQPVSEPTAVAGVNTGRALVGAGVSGRDQGGGLSGRDQSPLASSYIPGRDQAASNTGRDQSKPL